MINSPTSLASDVPRRTTIKYCLNRWDILRWHFYHLARNRVLIGFYLMVTLWMVWDGLRAPEMATRTTGFKIFFAAFFVAAMFCVVCGLTMFTRVCVVMSKKYRGFLGEHELEIRDDGLVERTDVNESLHRWTGFHKIIVTGRYLYIYVTDNNVHIVPRRHFASELELKAFRDEIERHIRSV